MKQARSEARKQAKIKRHEKVAELQMALEDRAAARRLERELAEVHRASIRWAGRFKVRSEPPRPARRTSPVVKYGGDLSAGRSGGVVDSPPSMRGRCMSRSAARGTVRPFNLRYAVRQRTGRYMPELLRTHRTAQASWLYIHRRHGIDDFGPTPDWSRRDDLVAAGRCAPARAKDPALDGIRLWMQADAHATAMRPDEPACAHAVGSLPMGEEIAGWRNLVTGFCEDHLTVQGMVCDWAIHHRAEDGERSAILPHVHMLITTRVYDPGHVDVGKVRQTWIRTEKARKALAEKWWEHIGMVPPA